MALPYQPWRAVYQPASFGGAGFHVEVDSQAGGRRNALHEFPHRDIPWAEDMGRKARHWPITGYVIGPNYLVARDALIAACEQEGSFSLVHPLFGTVQANCDDYIATERREQGGYCVFEMRFVEAGTQPGATVTDDTQSLVSQGGIGSDTAAVNSLNTSLGGSGVISDDVLSQESIASQTPVGTG